MEVVSAAVKRALWCRWFHRYRMPRRPEPPVLTPARDGGGGMLVMHAGPSRTCCDACEGREYESRAARRWSAS